MPFLRSVLLPCSAVAIVSAETGDPSFAPNQADEHTLHLWHLDEAGPPFADSGRQPFALPGLLNGATAGHPGAPGMGKALSFHANAGGTPGESSLRGAILLGTPTLASGTSDNIHSSFRYFGDGGAFTYELLVKLAVKPEDARVIALGLISMDGDGADRIFNFRIEKEGFLAFIPLPNSGASGGGIATIPRTGPHAIDTGSWFHAAVTYDGNAGATNNLRLYWTKLAPGLTAANPIGSGTLSGDLNGTTGDFAIGNEARSFQGNAEGEPFPGWIDEVRISGVARHPRDFFFVPPQLRHGETGSDGGGSPEGSPPFALRLAGVQVDSNSVPIPDDRMPLRLGSGLHRLDFDFGTLPDRVDDSLQLRCQLEGVDERWQESERGMNLVLQCLGEEGTVLSQVQFPFTGRSEGWQTSLEDSPLTPRREPVFVPAGTTRLKLTLGSGSPDTTGFTSINRLGLVDPADPGTPLWANGDFATGDNTGSPAGVPAGWSRGGTDPAIARLVVAVGRPPALGLADGSQEKHGEWTATQALDPARHGGRTLVFSWEEAYNVIGGSLHRATYVNVPPGRYTFRAIGLAGGESGALSLPIVIDPPFWKRLWFWPAIASTAVAIAAALAFRWHRRRVRRRLEKLRFQNALEQDRTRIARDLHDDLGTRITVLNMTAALARRDLDRDTEKARRHLDKMSGAARDLVTAMDDLVWAVDPAHDTLDHLASHLTRLAEEMFRDAPSRCRLDIPAILPAHPLGSEARHHIALAVKEALHNALRHAGPCDVNLSLAFDGETLDIRVRDDGAGFDASAHGDGHGLGNLSSRMEEIGGRCSIDSSPGGGTCVRLTCRLPERPR